MAILALLSVGVSMPTLQRTRLLTRTVSRKTVEAIGADCPVLVTMTAPDASSIRRVLWNERLGRSRRRNEIADGDLSLE